MALWIVPGAPLPHGEGWRIWCCAPGEQEFPAPRVQVMRKGVLQAMDSSEWSLLPRVSGLGRRMGVLTLRLRPTEVEPGAMYEFRIAEDAMPKPVRWRSLPRGIGPDGVTFLTASCFWHDSDREGTYAAGLKEIGKLHQPAFKFLLGDQVYADWPSEWGIGGSAARLYAGRYAQYWSDEAYREALRTCPNFFTCDDHEFWNDYPERQIHLYRTWTQARRDRYGEAADQLYYAYQRCLNPHEGRWYQFTIDPVSFFVTDTRSQREVYRKDGNAQFIPDAQWQALEQWQQSLRGPGVLVLGQPLFQKDGDWKDHSLSNFSRDYARLWALIERSLKGDNDHRQPHDILVLSGDIHTGRYAEAHGPISDAKHGVPEFIASPASMIVPGSTDVEAPPDRITVSVDGKRRYWVVDRAHVPIMTLDHNVGVVRMIPGTRERGQPRVRFECLLYRIRPYDGRSWWEKA
ncbi:MAG: hypothetical protein D6690_04220, partial [Nitrospirae bacterium]